MRINYPTESQIRAHAYQSYIQSGLRNGGGTPDATILTHKFES
jgi:hypothetical protein